VIVAPFAVKEAVPVIPSKCAVKVMYEGVVTFDALTWNAGLSDVIKIVAL
jgi:hypothetical protein